MIEIKINKSRLNTIKQRHYKFISKHIIGTYKDHLKKVTDKQVSGFIHKYLLNETRLKRLIIGTTDDLQTIIDDVNLNYPSIVTYNKGYFKNMYNDFNTYNIYSKTISGINEIIKEIEEDGLVSVKNRFFLRRKSKKRKKGELKPDYDYSGAGILSIENIISDMINEIELAEKKSCVSEELVFILEKYKEKIIDRRQDIYNNYDYYKRYDSKDILWGPYALLIELGLTVCPYCNRTFIHTYFGKDGKTRAELDHFLAKSKYPYLSVSFYNLVPSCSVCNSNLKKVDDFTYATHLNPYVKGFENEFRFTVKPIKDHTGRQNLDFLYGKSNKFRIDIVEKNCDSELAKKINANIKVFKLVELNNFHKDYVSELIRKSIIYNESRINELVNFKDNKNKNLFASKEEVLNMIVGNYTNKKDFDKRILSKLLRDIADELNLLDK